MKKILSILMVCLVALGMALVGCKFNPPSDGDTNGGNLGTGTVVETGLGYVYDIAYGSGKFVALTY